MPKTEDRPDRSKKKRIPLGARNVLTAPKKVGFFRYIFNDEEGEILRAQDAGYEIVTENVQLGHRRAGAASKEGSGAKFSVGGGINGVLMEIPEEYRKEDYEAEQKIIDDKESAIYKKFNNGRAGTYGSVT